MKLILHLGAHKTASTHFQHLLKYSFHQDTYTRYVCPTEFRHKGGSNFGGSDFVGKVNAEEYFRSLIDDGRHILISDENICGGSREIFHHKRLYQHLESRVLGLKPYIAHFNTIEVWLCIRSMATFLPSIYIEALRWGRYEDFKQVYRGYHTQSWLPVLSDIQQALPHARLNVVLYENYMRNVRNMLTAMGANISTPAPLAHTKLRVSAGRIAVERFEFMSRLTPASLQKRLFQYIEKIPSQATDKYKPFTPEATNKLDEIYHSDIAALATNPSITLYK